MVQRLFFCSLAIVLGALSDYGRGVHLLHEPELLDDTPVLLGIDGDALLLRKRDAIHSGIWYGPRLGRRDRRSTDETDLNTESPKEEVLEIIKEAPWALVPIKGAKRQLTFTPRLGRDTSEEDMDTPLSFMEQRSPPFAPRLGRKVTPFTPRLGRDQVYSPRLGRSTTAAKKD